MSGFSNTLTTSANSCIIGGDSNSSTTSNGTSILSSSLSSVSNSTNSSIIGGVNNTISGIDSFIVASTGCSITSSNTAIIGSAGNTNITNSSNSVSFGGAITLTNATGSFVFNDSTGALSVTTPYTFTAKASNGVTFYSDSGATVGVTLASGASSWSSVSDRNKKENIKEINYDEILNNIRNIPIYNYNYIGNNSKNPNNICIGPMAQDWNKQFKHNDAPLTISTQDFDGVQLACIKSLIKKIDELESEIIELKKYIKKL